MSRTTVRLSSSGCIKVVVCLTLTALVAGCGGSENTSAVSGKVTYNGEPVKGGSLTFLPQGGGDSKEAGTPGEATIKEDGTYTLEGVTGGATIGRQRVLYSAPVMDPGKELKPGESPPPSPYDGLKPKEEEVEVKSGSNQIDIELVKK